MNQIMRDRLGWLLDPGSFKLHGLIDDGELVGGTGMIGGRRVCVIAINPSSSITADPFDVLQQELALLDLAEEEHLPLIHLADRPGRVSMETTAIPFSILQTFIDPRGAGKVFARFAQLSGIVPRIAVVFRPIATTLTYPVAECDTVVMLEGAGMSLARPDMVKLMTGDPSPYQDYGGARMHAEIFRHLRHACCFGRGSTAVGPEISRVFPLLVQRKPSPRSSPTTGTRPAVRILPYPR